MTMKQKNKKDICLTTHDKMVPTTVGEQDMKKPRVVTDYNSRMGGVNLSDAYMKSYRSIRKRLKNYYQKHFHHIIDICCLNSYFLLGVEMAFPGSNFK
jgi:hypothetical protein